MNARTPAALLPVVLCGLLLAACMTTVPTERKADLKKAAASNVALGMNYMKLGQLQTAKDKLDSAEKQDPENFEVHWAQASLMELLEKPADAERYYRNAVRLAPENSALANTYGVYLCKGGKSADAIPLFETVMRDRLYPTPAIAATNAGMCLKSDKRNADAARFFERALALKPDHTEAVIQLADTQLVLGNAAAARQVVDRYQAKPNIQERALIPDVLVVGIRAARAQGDEAAVQTYATQLRRNFPQSPQAQGLPQLLK